MPSPSDSHTSTEKARDYKLIMYRSEDFKEVRRMDLSIKSLYIMASSVILLLCFLIFALLSYTPLKRLIPGYGKLEANAQFLELVDGVDDLTRQVDAQMTYIGGLRNLLTSGLADEQGVAITGASTASTSVNVSRQQRTNISVSPPQRAEIIASADSDYYDAIAKKKTVKPVNGLVSSSFDPQIKHYGIDILAPAETPILAVMDGIVFSSGWDLETGYSVAIQHDNNLLSFYKHNSQLLKEKGTFVRAGEAVAIIGNTGTLSSGPHLHFELWHNGKPINPQDIFKF